MTEWVLGASCAAVALTAAGYILPKGGVRNAALIAMGFMFLKILLPPLGNITESFINEKTALETEKNMLAAQIDENSAISDVMARYKERISDEIEAALGKMSVSCSNISVSVDEQPESDTFGYVLYVSCEIYAAPKESGGGIDKVTVPEIIIDLDGIHTESHDGNSAENEYIQSLINSASEAVAAVTGADIKNINVKWSGAA